MAVDPMTGRPVVSAGMPDMVGVAAGADQPDDGGITVRLMGDGRVRLLDDDARGGWDLEAFRAIDVGQRLIQMGTLSLQHRIRAMQGNQVEIRAAKPRIDIVRGLSLPKGER